MSEDRFQRLMRAIDPELLEEAQTPVKRRSYKSWAAAGVAACLCVAAAGIYAGQQDDSSATGGSPPQADAPTDASSMTALANPVHSATEAELEKLGYTMVLPEGASGASYGIIDSGSGGVPLAQVDFSYQEDSYTLRALKSGESADISGLYADWGEALEWQSGQLSIQYNSTDGMGWIGWYDGETQWCLSAGDGADAPLVNTAYSIMQTLGYDVDVAPEGASDVVYSAEPRDGLAVASCAFTLDGVRWTYSMAATSQVELPFQDISGLPDYAVTEDAKILWCPAVISYDESGAGKITWFDAAPGLVYSLSADNSAGRDALLDMANRLFTPAQGEVG